MHIDKFIEVTKCNECGVIGDRLYRSRYGPCPNCGGTSCEELIARWEEYKKVEGPKFVWYKPSTWKGQKITTIGAWVRKETVDGK